MPCHRLCMECRLCLSATNATAYMPACRSLSEVPKGLRPIRTTSGRVVAQGGQDAASLKGFVARLRWARQQSLQQQQRQPQPQSLHAAQSIQAQVNCSSSANHSQLCSCLQTISCTRMSVSLQNPHATETFSSPGEMLSTQCCCLAAATEHSCYLVW